MTTEGNYTFAGISEAEAQDRFNEHRTGVPAVGDGQTLLAAPARNTTGVTVVNNGAETAEVRLKHGTSTKSVAAEILAALGNLTIYRGKLANRAVTPGTVVITNAGAPADVVDDGNGVLQDVGTGTVRGTINYLLGLVDWTYGAAATLPVTMAYDHTDFTNFESPGQSTSITALGGGAGTGGAPHPLQMSFGRVNPGSVSITEGGALTFSDDGKGNIIQTNAGLGAVGTIDYATGLIVISDASGALTGTVITAFTFNPFASLLVRGGGQQGVTLLPGDIPELSAEPWADGIKGEDELSLWGESRSTKQTALTTQWVHHLRGHESYRVKEVFTAFPAGGQSNDPRVGGRG